MRRRAAVLNSETGGTLRVILMRTAFEFDMNKSPLPAPPGHFFWVQGLAITAMMSVSFWAVEYGVTTGKYLSQVHA